MGGVESAALLAGLAVVFALGQWTAAFVRELFPPQRRQVDAAEYLPGGLRTGRPVVVSGFDKPFDYDDPTGIVADSRQRYRRSR